MAADGSQWETRQTRHSQGTSCSSNEGGISSSFSVSSTPSVTTRERAVPDQSVDAHGNRDCLVTCSLYLRSASEPHDRRMYCSGAMMLIHNTAMCLPTWTVVLYLHYDSLRSFEEGREFLAWVCGSDEEGSDDSDPFLCSPLPYLPGSKQSRLFRHVVLVPSPSPCCGVAMLDRLQPLFLPPVETGGRGVAGPRVVVVRDADRELTVDDAWIIHDWLERIARSSRSSANTATAATPQLLRYFDDAYRVVPPACAAAVALRRGVPVIGGSFAVYQPGLLPTEFGRAFRQYHDNLCSRSTHRRSEYNVDQFFLATVLWDKHFAPREATAVTTVHVTLVTPQMRWRGSRRLLGDATDELDEEECSHDNNAPAIASKQAPRQKRPRREESSGEGSNVDDAASGSAGACGWTSSMGSAAAPVVGLNVLQLPVAIPKVGKCYAEKLGQLARATQRRLVDDATTRCVGLLCSSCFALCQIGFSACPRCGGIEHRKVAVRPDGSLSLRQLQQTHITTSDDSSFTRVTRTSAAASATAGTDSDCETPARQRRDPVAVPFATGLQHRLTDHYIGDLTRVVLCSPRR